MTRQLSSPGERAAARAWNEVGMSDSQQTVNKLLSLVVHDLRNPTTALGINLPYIEEAVRSLREGELSDDHWTDLQGALSDSSEALAGLLRGLEQFGWVARLLAGESPMPVADGDLAVELRELVGKHTRTKIELDLPEGSMNVKGANALVAAVEILVANAAQHAPPGSAVRVSARTSPNGPVVEIRDQGPAVGADLREMIFTVEGQLVSKKRVDGRYGRVVSLLAAEGLARSTGARLEADEDEGRALFRLRPVEAAGPGNASFERGEPDGRFDRQG